MTGFKRFLYVIYTLLFIATIIMFFYNDSLIASFGQPTMYTFWMFWALVGFVLLMLESVFENIHLWSVGRRHSRLERENTELKARLYDHLDARDRGGVSTTRDLSRRSDVTELRNEEDVVRVRERDGSERIVPKDRR